MQRTPRAIEAAKSAIVWSISGTGPITSARVGRHLLPQGGTDRTRRYRGDGMNLARRATDDLERNGSAPPVLLAPPPAEPALRVALASAPAPSERLSGTTLAVLATLAGIGAIALGSWAFASEAWSDDPAPTVDRPSTVATDRAIALLARPSTERIPLAGSEGRMVLAVGVGGRAALTLDGVDPLLQGETYHAWLIGPENRVVAPAGSFTGARAIVPLSPRVPEGFGIGVTRERVGARAPTKTLTLVASRG